MQEERNKEILPFLKRSIIFKNGSYFAAYVFHYFFLHQKEFQQCTTFLVFLECLTSLNVAVIHLDNFYLPERFRIFLIVATYIFPFLSVFIAQW